MLMSVDCNRPDGNNRTSDRKSAIAPCFLIDTKLTKVRTKVPSYVYMKAYYNIIVYFVRMKVIIIRKFRTNEVRLILISISK